MRHSASELSPGHKLGRWYALGVPNSPLIVDLEAGLRRLEVAQRLGDTPASAHTRGLFFRLAEAALVRKDPSLVDVWRAESGARYRWPVKLYATRDFIREQAIAAVLIDPLDPEQALYDMWLHTPKLSPLIRAERFMRYLVGTDPPSALSWLEKNRGMMCDYGLWRLERLGEREYVFHIAEEYVWIDSAHRGGARGTLDRSGVRGEVRAELVSRYHGRLRFTWE